MARFLQNSRYVVGIGVIALLASSLAAFGLSTMIVLVIALKFLEHLVEWSNAADTFFYGLAIAVVSAALIALSYLGSKNTGGQE